MLFENAQGQLAVALESKDLPQCEYQLLVLIALNACREELRIKEVQNPEYQLMKTLPQGIRFNVQISFNSIKDDLHKLKEQKELDDAYIHLITVGAPKIIMQRLFAVSRAKIENDRAKLNLGRKFAGRPAKLQAKDVSLVISAWEDLLVTKKSVVQNLVMLTEQLGHLGVPSVIQTLLENYHENDLTKSK